MTYIEFFDKTLIENICASLTNPPERVILVGDKKKLLESQAQRYTRILHTRGHEVEFLYKTANKNNIQNVLEVLSEIVETYEDCVFDLTGGEEIYLVASGIIYERYKDKNIQMHRFNLRNNTIQDCDFDGETILESTLPELTVEENIRVYGGEVVWDDLKTDTTPKWNMDDDFAADIDAMWDVCRNDVRLWNTQIGVFAAAEHLRDPNTDELLTTVYLPSLEEYLKRLGSKYVFIHDIIHALFRTGLINAQEEESHFAIAYKNAQVKKCLTKAGQALEMKIYLSALRACEKDDSRTYNDVMNGVHIDWDGDLHTAQEDHDTENEIDVMMMHGMVPVFVSCKNGYIDLDELYKLNTVASRFGGKYAKKVLVATALDETSGFAARLRERAKGMQIRVVPSSDGERVQDMNDAELQKLIKTFWNN